MGLFGRSTYGDKTRFFAGGSETVLAHVGQSRRRRKIVFALAVVLLAVGGITTFVVLRILKAAAAERVVNAYGAITRCLLGEPPAAGVKPSASLRARQLAILTQHEAERAGGKDPWPDRCAAHAFAFAEAVKGGSVSDGGEIVQRASALAELLKRGDGYWQDASALVDGLFEFTGKAGLGAAARPDVPEPPAAAAPPLSVDSLAQQATMLRKTRTDLATIAIERGTSAVRLLVEGEDAEPPKLCTFTQKSARCDGVPAGLATVGGLELRGTSDDDAPPLVFAAAGAQGAWRGGAKIAVKRAVGGYSQSAGPGVVLAFDDADGKLELVLGPGEKAKRIGVSFPGKLKAKDGPRNATMMWSDVLVTAADDKRDLVLVSARLAADGSGLGKPVELGEFAGEKRGEGASRFGAACKNDLTAAVRIDVGADSWLTQRDAEVWGAPFKLGKAGGQLHCAGGEVIVTRIDKGAQGGLLDATIVQARCGGGACKEASVGVQPLFASELGLAPAQSLSATSIGSKLAVAWVAGQRGGVRLRVDALGALAKAADNLLFDDLVNKGELVAESTVRDLRLLAGDGFGLLLLDTTLGLFALRVGADGQVSPIKL